MRVSNFVTDGSWVFVNFMIVSSFVALVSEKVDFIVLFLNELKAERFVPPFWEHIERYLTSD